MYKILLACSAGMSTSILQKNMEDYAKTQNIECVIEAHPLHESKQITEQWDIILLGPQVKYEEATFKTIVNNSKPVIVVPPQIYAMGKGQDTMELAIKALNDFKK